MDGGKGQRRLLLFLAVVTIAGIGALYLVGSGVEPAPVAISELKPSMAGESVVVQGLLIRAEESHSGLWLTLSDGERTAELDAFVPATAHDPDASYIPGSVWSVEGELVFEEGRYKMYLQRADKAVLVRPASDNFVPLLDLCQSPGLYEGLEVVTEGAVQSSYAIGNTTAIYLCQGEGGYDYTLPCVVPSLDVEEGVRIRVAGVFAYDSLRARYHIRSSLPPTVISP